MYSILIDITRCIGCERCVEACIESKGIDERLAMKDRAVTRDGLSAHRLTSVLKVDEGHFAKKSCMHCVEPSCVSACLVGGITKSKEGPVIYDPEKCIGCRYCMLACPFHIPRYEWEKPIPYMQKCDMCFQRLVKGEKPACVDSCPNNVLQFGQREELLRIARDRIANNPNRYIDRIWGEHEFGGTGVMYISDVDLNALGYPQSETESIPELTEPLISKTPLIGLSVMGSILGLNWIIRRRDKLMKENKQGNMMDNEKGDSLNG